MQKSPFFSHWRVFLTNLEKYYHHDLCKPNWLHSQTAYRTYPGFFFDISRKTQVRKKLRFLRKLRYFSQNSGPKTAKTYPNRKKIDGTAIFMYLGFGNFQQLRLIFEKLRPIFDKLRSGISKNIPQPQIHCKLSAGKVSKKKSLMYG